MTRGSLGQPCLLGLAQQAVDTLSRQGLADYKKVKVAVLQILKS